MLGHQLCAAVTAAIVVAISLAENVAAGPPKSSSVEVLETRRALPIWDGHIVQSIRDSRFVAGVLGRASPEVYTTNASLDLSWSNAELFS